MLNKEYEELCWNVVSSSTLIQKPLQFKNDNTIIFQEWLARDN